MEAWTAADRAAPDRMPAGLGQGWGVDYETGGATLMFAWAIEHRIFQECRDVLRVHQPHRTPSFIGSVKIDDPASKLQRVFLCSLVQ